MVATDVEHNRTLEIQKTARRIFGKREQQIGKPRGFVRSFVDRAPLMHDLLQALLEKNPKDEYVRKLLKASDRDSAGGGFVKTQWKVRAGSGNSAQTSNNGVGLLSNREVDVMVLLAARLSNKEVALRLFLSTMTAKKHVSNILRKLDVHNRREAVAVVRKAGLIPLVGSHQD